LKVIKVIIIKEKLKRTRKCLMLLKYPLFRSPIADLRIGRMQIPTFSWSWYFWSWYCPRKEPGAQMRQQMCQE